MTSKQAIILAVVLSFLAGPLSAEWKPAKGPLTTRWTKEVSPDNAHPEYPRPQMVRKDWLNLNGLWQFEIVGKDATAIAAKAGIDVPAGTRALVVELEGVGRDHPLSIEKLSPILAFYVVDDWKEGCERAIQRPLRSTSFQCVIIPGF